jgi:hypothetical protein
METMMQSLGDPRPYEYAMEELRPGLWLVDVDLPRLRLQFQSVIVSARTEEELDVMLWYKLQLLLARLFNPPRACLN